MAKKLVGTVNVFVQIFHGSEFHSYWGSYQHRPMPEASSPGRPEITGADANDRRLLFVKPDIALWDKRSAILAIGSPGTTVTVSASSDRQIGAGSVESHATGSTVNNAEASRSQARNALQAVFAGCTASTLSATAAFKELSSGDTFRVDVPEDVREKFPYVQGSVVDVRPAAVLPHLEHFFLQASEQLGGLYLDEPAGEPKIEGQTPAVTTRKTLSVKLLEGKKSTVSETVKVPLFIDDSTDKWYVGEVKASDLTGSFAQAKAKADAYDRSLQTGMLRMMEGQPFVHPGPRPPETMSPDLAPVEREYMDNWWSAASKVRDTLQVKEPMKADDAYANYAAAHPGATREEWDATRNDRIEDAVDQLAKQQPGSDSFWDKATAGLGWAGDKASAGLAWAGDAMLDVLKAWGPTGVVGAYAGVKATDKAVEGLSPAWIGFGVIALAVVLLK